MTAEQKDNVARYLNAKSNARCRRRIDGEKVECEECGSSTELEWHHIIPFSEGGTDNPGNLAVLCKACHILMHKDSNHFKKAGRWGGLVSAYLREQRLGRQGFCNAMRALAKKRWAA